MLNATLFVFIFDKLTNLFRFSHVSFQSKINKILQLLSVFMLSPFRSSPLGMSSR